MPRVLFVLPRLDAGGAERVVLLLLEHLPRVTFELHLAVTNREGPLLSRLPLDIQLHDLAAVRVRSALLTLRRLIEDLQPDVIVSELAHVSLALLLLRPVLPRATRVVVHEHTTLSTQRDIPYRWIRHVAYRLLYRRADLIVCCSRAVAADLERRFGLPTQLLRVVGNPVDEPEIERSRAMPSPFVGPGPHIVGLGRMAFEKGFDRLIDAFSRVLPRRPAAQLWLLGDGPQRGILAETARTRGLGDRVHIQGHCDNPFPWLWHADVLVQASRREGLPLAVLEAMACKTRIVAFDCPGGTSEILRNSTGTVLVPDGDVVEMADALERFTRADAPRPLGLPQEFRLAAVVGHFADALEHVSVVQHPR